MTFGGLVIILVVLFSIIFLLKYHNMMIESIDDKLFDIVRIEKELFLPDYHDKIISEKSVSKETYDYYVDRNNKLCNDLDIQYLWSVILIDGNVHFTSATSPDKILENNKHASFFAIHSNPEAFDSVFNVMKPVISEFHNEWGNGRMLLYPNFDIQGRKYCFGASLSIEHIDKKIRTGIILSVLILIVLLLIFFFIAFIMAKSVSKPIKSIRNIADCIALGKPIEILTEKQKKWEEIDSLNTSVLMMHQQIKSKIQALEEAKTKLEKNEERLRNHNIELDKKVEERTIELNKLLKDKDRFITILGHDLKSPFNSILGILNLLENNLQNLSFDQIEKHVTMMHKSAQNVYKLLEDILLWARAQSGKLPFFLENLVLVNLLNETIDYFEPAIREKEHNIQLFIQKDVLVFADRNMLQTILRNLIFNAIKFTNKNGEISIYAEQSDAEVIVTVSDTGIGIEKDKFEKLFDNSEIITSPGTNQEKGTGLGLLICKEFTEIHGGKIWVESELNKGSDFKFTVPLNK